MDELIHYEQDGHTRKTTSTFFRGEHTAFYPYDDSLGSEGFVERYFMRGLAPAEPLIDHATKIVAFGSCFASHIGTYLARRGFSVLGRTAAAVTRMGDGIVNTHAIRQQFEWAWTDWRPARDLWHGYDAAALGCDEDARLATREMFDAAELFVLTLGLSEIWYDAPSGEVFWRAVPTSQYDPTRHKFRTVSAAENLANLKATIALIRAHRPGAAVIITVSPIPLTATFRPIAATTANAVSKASLRVAVDELCAAAADPGLFYFPSYEIALGGFTNHFMEDRRHIHAHVLDFNMKVFERYYCRTGLADSDLQAAYADAAALDAEVGRGGHWSVPRAHLKDSRPIAPR